MYVPLTATSAGASHSASVSIPAAVTSGSSAAGSFPITTGHSTKQASSPQVLTNLSSSATGGGITAESSSSVISSEAAATGALLVLNASSWPEINGSTTEAVASGITIARTSSESVTGLVSASSGSPSVTRGATSHETQHSVTDTENASGSAVVTASNAFEMTSSKRTSESQTNPSTALTTAHSFESPSNSGLSTTAQLIGNTSRGSTVSGNVNRSTTARQLSTTALCVTNPCDDNSCEHDGECIGLLFTNGSSDFLCMYAYAVNKY